MAMIEAGRFTFDPQVQTEGDLKAVVINQLRDELEAAHTATLASEYRLGSTPVRVDLAVLGNAFIGIEIKSPRDSLKRLPRQMAAYTAYFERVILAVADCHIQNLDWKALRSVEVWSVSESGRVRIVSQPTQMAECRSLGDLLTADQLRRYRLDVSSSDPELTEAFTNEFHKRFGTTSSAFWSAVKGRKVEASDLEVLSRFRDRRLAVERWSQKQHSEWEIWQTQVSALVRP